MAGRGVLFAIDDETASALLAAESDNGLMEIIGRLEEAWGQGLPGRDRQGVGRDASRVDRWIARA